MGKRGATGAKIVVSKHFCVSGGSCSAPIALHTRLVDDIECVLVSAFSERGWLPTVLCGQARGVGVDVVRRVQDEVLRRLGGEAAGVACEAAGAACVTPTKAAVGSSSEDLLDMATQSHKMGREALGLDDDSDEEALQGVATPTKKRSGASCCKVAPSWTTVSLDCDIEITVRKIDRGRGFLVPVEEDLERLLNFMHGKLAEEVDAPTPRRELRSASTPERKVEDKARVTWSFAQDA